MSQSIVARGIGMSWILVLIAVGAALVSGCTSVAKMPEEERSRVYQQPVAEVFEAALEAINAEGWVPVEADQDDGQLTFKQDGDFSCLMGYTGRLAMITRSTGETKVMAYVESDCNGTAGPEAKKVRKLLAALDAELAR
jgi:hypothetical protein